jgi:hypothetical protein
MECRATSFQKLGLIALMAFWFALTAFSTGVIFQNAAPPLAVRTAGWIGLVCLVWLFPFLRCFFLQRAVVVVSDDGIDDVRLGFGLIPWRDIVSTSVIYLRNRPQLQLWLRDREGYIQRWSMPRRIMSRVVIAMGYSPFSMNFIFLSPGFKPVADYVTRRVPARSET